MLDLVQRSIEVILQNQAASGAYIASPNLPAYRYSWFRDGAYIAYAMDLAGEKASAARFHAWSAAVINARQATVERAIEKANKNQPLQDTDILHTRYTPEGREGRLEEWPNYQLDGLGTWLWALRQHAALDGAGLPDDWQNAAHLAAAYLAALWRSPCYDCWEEFGDRVHPHTLAAIYGGLKAYKEFTAENAEDAEEFKEGSAVEMTDIHHSPSRVLREDTETTEEFKETSAFPSPWRVGPGSAFSAVNIALSAIKDYIEAHFVFDGHFVKFEGQPAVDASLVALATPYNVIEASDPRMKRTVIQIEGELMRDGGGLHPLGGVHPIGGVHRYVGDTYYGGGEWVLLAAWLGWYHLQAGESGKARPLLRWVESQADARGLLPEQVPVNLNAPESLDAWRRQRGEIATPLLWSHAKYLILALSL